MNKPNPEDIKTLTKRTPLSHLLLMLGSKGANPEKKLRLVLDQIEANEAELRIMRIYQEKLNREINKK